jgi:hypothetical protein
VSHVAVDVSRIVPGAFFSLVVAARCPALPTVPAIPPTERQLSTSDL